MPNARIFVLDGITSTSYFGINLTRKREEKAIWVLNQKSWIVFSWVWITMQTVNNNIKLVQSDSSLSLHHNTSQEYLDWDNWATCEFIKMVYSTEVKRDKSICNRRKIHP